MLSFVSKKVCYFLHTDKQNNFSNFSQITILIDEKSHSGSKYDSLARGFII